MRVGDLIEWGGRRWFVRSLERSTRTAIIFDGDGESSTIPDDLNDKQPTECVLLANPPDEWPSVAVNQKAKYGKLLGISKPLTNGSIMELVRLTDWMMGDPNQVGGAIFFNPSLGLRLGDILIARYKQGQSRVTIPREFLSAEQRRAKAEADAAASVRLSVYDRLRRNPFADDD